MRRYRNHTTFKLSFLHVRPRALPFTSSAVLIMVIIASLVDAVRSNAGVFLHAGYERLDDVVV